MTEQEIKVNISEKLTLLFMLSAVFVALFFGLESWVKNIISINHSAVAEQRRYFTSRLAAITSPDQYVIRQTLPLLRSLTDNPNADLARVRSEYLENRALDLSIYQFDAAGKIVSTAPAKAANLWLMRNLYAAFLEKDARKVSQLRKGLDKKVEFSFGFGKDLNSIRDYPETIIETAFDDKRGFITWTCRPEGGIIITCNLQPNETQVFQMTKNSLPPIENLKSVGLLDTAINNNYSIPLQARNFLGRQSAESGLFRSHYWVFTTTDSGRTVFAAFSPIPEPFRKILHLGRLILACMLAALLMFFLTASSQAIVSLKKLVISMFFASSFVPLSAIAFASIENIDVYRQTHTNKFRSAKEEALRNLIQNYTRHNSAMSQKLVKLTSNPGNGQQDPKTISMVKEIRKHFPEAKIYLRNSTGDTIFSNSVEISAGRETVMKSLTRLMVERYAPERINEKKYSGNIFADSMVRKDDMGFGTILNYPNRIQLIGTGNSELLLFFRMIPAEHGECAVVLLEFSTIENIRRYLASIGRNSVAADISLQISAFYPKGFRWSLPPLQKNEKTVLELAQIANATNKPQFRHISSENLFALSIPAPELSGNCLTAVCSSESIEAEIARIKQRIVAASVMAIFLVFAIAMWISRQLIKPLQHLESGIGALAERRFEVKIPVPPGKDEFSQLFSAFNDMMAESYDMQIAHNVQEGLVPTKFPNIAGYSIHGILRAASDLGGDCLDCFELPDEKLLFLVGDITGHGVGSALIMAFARAVTFHWSLGSTLSPISLTEQIDAMLRKNHTERMFMGIICGILDLKKHEVEMVTRGHIYPLIMTADGRTQWRGIPAYPLGIGKARKPESFKIKLEEGDSILCVTDGFLESYNRNMQGIGFEGVEIWAKENFNTNAQQWIADLENRFRIRCRESQSDDISIFALNRLIKESDS